MTLETTSSNALTTGLPATVQNFSPSLPQGRQAYGQRYESFQTSYDPETQVEQTMPLIRRYASVDARDPRVLGLAASYIKRMPGASKAEIAWQAAKDHLVFLNDQAIAGSETDANPDDVVEVLRRPVDVILYNRIVGQKSPGDCDDHTMFVISMALAIASLTNSDVDARPVCVAAVPEQPNVLSHIYAMIDGVSCDASHGEFAGWEVPADRVSRRVVYSAIGPWDTYGVLFLLGLAALGYVFRGVWS